MTPAFLLSQQEISEQVGCSDVYVGKVKKDNVTSYNIPTTRTDSQSRGRDPGFFYCLDGEGIKIVLGIYRVSNLYSENL